jgi:TolB-like protein
MKNHYKSIVEGISKSLWILMLIVLSTNNSSAQKSEVSNKESIAVINVDAQGLNIKMPLLTSLMTLELERLDIFEVIDKYDVTNHMKQNNISLDEAYGKTDLVRIGKLLQVDKVLSGSAEKFGDKLIVVVRLIDIKTDKIVKVDVMEYLDQEEDIQEMIRISLHNIFGIDNDKNTVDMLSNFNPPLANSKSKINLNGPRFGASMTFGDAGNRLQAPKDQGGYNMFPVASLFGYQHEVQFISSGDFQALFEFVGTLNALESGYIIPSLSIINGFRFNKSGLEFGIGPVFRVVQMKEGYYDSNGNWNLPSVDDPPGQEYISQIDNRGEYKFSTGLILAIGVTLKSGYINFPINAYISPRKEGTVFGVMVGFNVANARKKKLLK